MSHFQIYVQIGDGEMQPGRIYEDMGKGRFSTLKETRQAYNYECEMAEQAAKPGHPITVELRDIKRGLILAHKRYLQ